MMTRLEKKRRWAARSIVHRDVQGRWERTLRELGVGVATLPFPRSECGDALWLPDADQAILVVRDLRRPTLAMGAELDALIGDRGHEDPLDLTEDLRVLYALPDGRFFGHRGGSFAVFSRGIDFNQCASCRQWWFCCSWGGWECRCCGSYSGNAGIEKQFSDSIPWSRVERSEGI